MKKCRNCPKEVPYKRAWYCPSCWQSAPKHIKEFLQNTYDRTKGG